MKKTKPSLVRQSGGSRSNLGGLDSERMEKQAVQAAVQQKAQQQTGSTAGSQSRQLKQSRAQAEQSKTKTHSPRAVGSLKQELIARPVEDMKDAFTSFFDINVLLNIDQESDSPAEQAKKREIHRRLRQLTQAEQEEAQKQFRLRMKQKQAEEKEKELKKQQSKEQEKKPLTPPSGKVNRKGLFLTGQSNKKKAQNRLQQQRRTIGTV